MTDYILLMKCEDCEFESKSISESQAHLLENPEHSFSTVAISINGITDAQT